MKKILVFALITLSQTILLSHNFVLETERLICRCPNPEQDAQKYFEAINETTPNLRRWMGFRPESVPKTLEASEQRLSKYAEEKTAQKNIFFLIFKKDDSEVVGAMNLWDIDWEALKFDIGA